LITALKQKNKQNFRIEKKKPFDVESSVSCKLWLTTEDLSPSFEFFSILFVTLLGLREALGALEKNFFRCKYTYFNWFQTNEAKKIFTYSQPF